MRTASRPGPIAGLAGSLAGLAGLAGLLAACGDGDDPDRCDPDPPALPTVGPLLDPLAPPLADCVEGGLRDLPGRWFVAAEGPGFSFEYPRFEGTCQAGFKRTFRTEDHDAADGTTAHTWSDGTRIFLRSYRRSEIPDKGTFELADAFAACLRADGSLAAHRTLFDTDRGERNVSMTGRRFAPKDGAPVGLRLVGEVGQQNGRRIEGLNVVLDGAYAYVAGLRGLDVIDVSTPSAPVPVGHVDGNFNDVRVVRGAGATVAYGASRDVDTTAVIDVTNPASPVLASVIPEYSHSLQVQESGGAVHLYLANYTSAVPEFDVTNPLAPVRLGQATVPGPESDIHDLTVDGDRLYVNYTKEGLVALDIAGGLDAAVELGRRKSPYSHTSWVGTAGGRQLVLHGDEGMVEDGGAYLAILDGDPASPAFLQELARYRTRPEIGIHNFQLVGDKVYIAYYQDGVRVVDLSTPSAPREVAHFNTWVEEDAYGGPFEGAVGIRVVGGLIYVADLERGLIILSE